MLSLFFLVELHTLWALLVSLVSTKVVKLVVKLCNNRACNRTKQGHNDHTGKKPDMASQK